MFKQLIITTDLSRDSNAFINCLGGLKLYGAEKCLLLQCLNIEGTIGINESYNSIAFSIFEKILQSQKESLEKQGYSVEIRVLSETARNEINMIAVEEDYSAIVVDANKRFSSGEVVFSELADDLIHNAQKPILLIRSNEHTGEGSSYGTDVTGCEIGNHVLFPTDFSDNANFAFGCMVEMAADKAKKITLLHVQDKSRISPYLDNRLEEFNATDRARLESMKKILQEKGNAEVEIVLKYGSPSVEILNFVKEYNVQLVVMGSQGRGFVNEFFLGSVSHNIARHSRSSVLLVPAKRKE